MTVLLYIRLGKSISIIRGFIKYQYGAVVSSPRFWENCSWYLNVRCYFICTKQLNILTMLCINNFSFSLIHHYKLFFFSDIILSTTFLCVAYLYTMYIAGPRMSSGLLLASLLVSGNSEDDQLRQVPQQGFPPPSAAGLLRAPS